MDLLYRDKLILLRAARPDAAAQDRALAFLSRLPTTTTAGGPATVRAQAVFGRAPTGLAIPLNRKTTQQAIQMLPLLDLEPRQDEIPVHGLTSYIARPRRDPPDVVRVQMRDGRLRLLVQEGHTRIGAALLRGDAEMPVRVWEFMQTDRGDFQPVVRGRHRIGQRFRDRLKSLTETVDVPADKIISLPFGEYADFDDCVARNAEKDDPKAFCGWLKHRIEGSDAPPVNLSARDHASLDEEVINLPDIADVSFPSLIGAIPPNTPTPIKKKRRRPVKYKGVALSRTPMAFETQILSLSEIPPRLDAAVRDLERVDTAVITTLRDVARFGAVQALTELVRQGAPDGILIDAPACEAEVRQLSEMVRQERGRDLAFALSTATATVGRRRISAARREVLALELAERSTPAILKRHAKRAVNMAFALGRAAAIAPYRRPKLTLDLANKFDKLESGDIWVDAVIQSAVMDTNTCDECEEVDGEQMELGDARQEELHPPYVKCLGGDRCRCVQIALLSDGSEIEVDEVPDEAYPDDEEDI